MLPVFHADNFKTWTPPSRTRRPSSKPPCLHEPASPNKPSSIKLPQPSLSQALPLSTHELPARPPAEVCVHASAVTPSIRVRSPQYPQSTSQKPSRLHLDTTTTTSAHSHCAVRRGQSPGNRASPSSTSDLAPSREVHDAFDASVDTPSCPDDASRYISSPSVSSSDESWQELLQSADEQNGIPVDPVILTNDGPWETEDERRHIHADSGALILETTCPYPDPPPLLRDVPAQYQHSNTYPGVQKRYSRLGSPLPNQSRAQVSAHNNDSEGHIRASGNLVEVANSGLQSKPRKRTSQESHAKETQPQQCKRVRKSSAVASTTNSFSSLQSHFMSASVDERLQFLSWLFEGALPRCVSQSDSEAPICIARPAHHLVQELVLELKRDGTRPWREVIEMFSDQFPGRTPGSIKKLFWTSTPKNRAH